MKRNFKFDGATVVYWNSRFLDLHNAYDLTCFKTDLNGGEVTLSFRRNKHAIEPDKLPLVATIKCGGDVRTAFSDLCLSAGALDDEGIEIAYFDESCDWLSVLDEDIAAKQEPQGLHVSFMNGLAFRIYCDVATLSVQ